MKCIGKVILIKVSHNKLALIKQKSIIDYAEDKQGLVQIGYFALQKPPYGQNIAFCSGNK